MKLRRRYSPASTLRILFRHPHLDVILLTLQQTSDELGVCFLLAFDTEISPRAMRPSLGKMHIWKPARWLKNAMGWCTRVELPDGGLLIDLA
jgi:hypothetical protein